MSFPRHHSALIVSSIVTVASFVAATAYTQNRLARLDDVSSTLERNAVPSVEYLSRAAVRLTRLTQLVDDMAASDRRDASTLATARTEAGAVEDAIRRYLELPPLRGERDFWAALRTDVAAAVQLVRASIDRPAGDAAGAVAQARVDESLDRATRSVLATLDYDVRQSESLARDVRTVREITLRTIVRLDAAAAAIALSAVFVAYRASRRHDELVDAHNALLSARVDELDRFAGRVAHDVLSPLGTIAAGLALLGHGADARGRTYVERSERALLHVQQLVADLLAFARSGARPDPGASCPIDAVVRGIVTEATEAAAEKGIRIEVDVPSGVEAPCSAGVLTSVVQNLVRNAIKYMGTGEARRIDVRARPAGDRVRLEVQDTGPGIPEGLRARIFEPFVRGPHEHVSGTGLGLATVKRLVESHGGSVGVASAGRSGTLFWVELPSAVAAHEHTI